MPEQVDKQEKEKSTRRSVLEAPASDKTIRKVLADLVSGAPQWPWIAVAANRWEICFILLPPVTCVVFLALQLFIGGPDFLFRASWLARETVCMFGDVVALCRAEEWFEWTPGFSLLALVNVTALFSSVVLIALMVQRRWEGTIVFRRPKQNWFAGVFLLACIAAFFWGIYFYFIVSLLGAAVMSAISVVALNGLRFAAACLLIPSELKAPDSEQTRTRSRWYGPPIRRARFIPAVGVGEDSKAEIVRDEK